MTSAEEKTIVLYRPVGQLELELIQASNWKSFPPRLPSQPIFYPVLSEDYAIRIAREWNTQETGSGNVGYVTRFGVRKSFLDGFAIQTVGGRDLQEYWIPAERLQEFNSNIVGVIEVIHEFRGTTVRE